MSMKKCHVLVLVWMASSLIARSALYAQACPACSNPALQSSEKLEANFDTLHRRTLRLTLNLTNGFDYRGGHPNDKGLTPEGDLIEVPLHNHVVSLDFLRTEMAVEYTFSTNWSVWLRIPFDLKAQTAAVAFVEPATPWEQEAILRNGYIHHRTETYRGFSDLRLLVARRINGLFGARARLDLAVGSSLPIGRIEDDPLRAGDEGREHLHIQFGTGTFDPLFEWHFAMALSERLSWAFFSLNRVVLYENARTYRGPFETTTGISTGWQLSPRLTLRATLANFSQTQATWNGVKDPNSGLVSWNASLYLTVRLPHGLTITPGYRHPLWQRTLSDEGDIFTYGPTFLLNVSRPFQL